jgi:outer membrane protein assembly factor BamB
MRRVLYFFQLLSGPSFLLVGAIAFAAEPALQWPMAGGPDGSWRVAGTEPPLNWSVRSGENVLWKTTLPEGGQSGITVWGDRVFLATMKPFEPEADPDEARMTLVFLQQKRQKLAREIDEALNESKNKEFLVVVAEQTAIRKEVEDYLSKKLNQKTLGNETARERAVANLIRRDKVFQQLHNKQLKILAKLDRVRGSVSDDFLKVGKSIATAERIVRSVTRIYGADIDAYCLDANSGELLWKVRINGSADSPYNYGFSDSSSPTPITDGKHVWFYNASGAMGCWNMDGKELWVRKWTPSGNAPFNKQFEPIKFGDAILNVEPLDADDPRRLDTEPQWNYVRGIHALTGKTLWISEDAITHYNTPVFSRMNDGTPAILQGRGGPHGVPERPVGLSMTSLKEGSAGKTLWQFKPQETAKSTPYGPLANQHWDNRYAYWLKAGALELQVIDVNTGRPLRSLPLTKDVVSRRYDSTKKTMVTEHLQQISGVIDLRHTNVVANGHFYFLLRAPGHRICRVNVETGKTEYLELPSQVLQGENGQPDQFVWGDVQTNDTRNSRGLDVAADKRIKLGGFTKSFLGAPTVVNDRIYFTTMIGLTYVIDANAKEFDNSALLAVNDIGPVGQTWSVNSISYANGRLFHRSMKEVICIGRKE